MQPMPLNDDLPQPWASVPGEVPAEELKLSKPICKVCNRALSDDDAYPLDGEIYCWDHYPSSEVPKVEEQPAESPAEDPQAQEEPAPELITEAAPEKKKLDLSVILENSAEALGYSEEYIQQVYDSAVLAVEKLENRINRDREKLIEKRELVEELGRKFSFVTRTRDDLKGYVQGSLPLKFDDAPTGDPGSEVQASAEISGPAPEETSQEAPGAEELCEPEPELNIVTGLPEGEIPEDDVPF